MKRYLNLLLLIIAVPLLILSYKYFSSKIVISYYDEEEWIGKSCFLQPYLEHNFTPLVWDTYYTIDHPILMPLSYGLWLYPKYLQESALDSSLDFNKYLINHGFNYCDHIYKYKRYRDSLQKSFVTLGVAEGGFPGELINKHGYEIEKNIEVIQYSRMLNILLLTISVITLFNFVKKNRGYLLAFVFSFLYAFNYLILTICLPANADALLLLLFNLTSIILFKYLYEGQKNKTLLLFSILTGLTFSTKLNGIILYFIFVFQYFFVLSAKNFKEFHFYKTLLKLYLPVLISIILFILLNPYTYTSPLLNIQKMFNHRVEAVAYQSVMFKDLTLNTLTSRLMYIGTTFFNNSLFIDITWTFLYKVLGIVFFAIGFIGEFIRIKRGNNFSRYMFLSFVMVFVFTIAYLQISWERYLLFLILFIIYYQAGGIVFCYEIIRSQLSKVYIYSKHKHILN